MKTAQTKVIAFVTGAASLFTTAMVELVAFPQVAKAGNAFVAMPDSPGDSCKVFWNFVPGQGYMQVLRSEDHEIQANDKCGSGTIDPYITRQLRPGIISLYTDGTVCDWSLPLGGGDGRHLKKSNCRLTKVGPNRPSDLGRVQTAKMHLTGN